MACRICDSESVEDRFVAREMMEGLREEFDYFVCGSCGALQIAAQPPDMAKYYAGGYYAHVDKGLFRGRLRRAKIEHALRGGSPLGALWLKLRPPYLDHDILLVEAPPDARILDIGCGRGVKLESLAYLGYKNLTGIDPFLGDAAHLDGLITLMRKSVFEMDPADGRYDVILMHHAFEHVWEQAETMRRIRDLLEPGGAFIMWIPFAESYAWEHYGTNWVQLDAPRHFVLHTRRSLAALAERTGMRIESLAFDSHRFQFWGSEQYARDIPLHSPRSYARNPRTDLFTPAQLAEFDAQSQRLNEEGRGDQVRIVWRRA